MAARYSSGVRPVSVQLSQFRTKRNRAACGIILASHLEEYWGFRGIQVFSGRMVFTYLKIGSSLRERSGRALSTFSGVQVGRSIKDSKTLESS